MKTFEIQDRDLETIKSGLDCLITLVSDELKECTDMYNTGNLPEKPYIAWRDKLEGRKDYLLSLQKSL